MKELNNLENVLSCLGITYGLVNIQEVLGIILLILNICLILSKAILKIVTALKNKKYDKIDDIIEETIENINNLKEEEKNASNK